MPRGNQAGASCNEGWRVHAGGGCSLCVCLLITFRSLFGISEHAGCSSEPGGACMGLCTVCIALKMKNGCPGFETACSLKNPSKPCCLQEGSTRTGPYANTERMSHTARAIQHAREPSELRTSATTTCSGERKQTGRNCAWALVFAYAHVCACACACVVCVCVCRVRVSCACGILTVVLPNASRPNNVLELLVE